MQIDDERWARWQDAQDHELGYWARRVTSRTQATQRAYWKDRWEQAALQIGPADRVLEVGGGPLPMLSEMPVHSERRVVVEPLAKGYRDAGYDLDESLEWVAAPIETAPIEGPFSHIIAINSLDHVSDPDPALRRMAELLESGGSLFISVTVRLRLGVILNAGIVGRLRSDHYHPSPLSTVALRTLLKRHGFQIVKSEFWRHQGWYDSASVVRRLKGKLIAKNILVWATKS